MEWKKTQFMSQAYAHNLMYERDNWRPNSHLQTTAQIKFYLRVKGKISGHICIKALMNMFRAVNRCFGLACSILILSSLATVTGCPSEVCICKWKGGKQTVECGGQQLASIPEGMDPGTQVLNFSGNSLQVLQSERFLRMDLLNLQKIYLSRNQLIRIHEKAFRGLTNLVELDLSENSLQHVPSETFQDYSSLMRLSLSGNPIRELKTSAFRHLSFLTTLELSNCQIERIENEAFVGMDNLEWLRLDGNRISFIQGAHILPKSLHGISLQSNRWYCDCRLLDMHAWVVNYNTPQSEEPKCVEPPRLKGQVIKNLKKDELACLPEVRPQSTYTEVSEGRNISIPCIVRAIPEPKVLWLFNGQVMTNDSLVDNLHMFYYIDESGSAEEKRSEIFIYNVGVEDNGTFSCVGQNVAGTTFTNYTLRVIIKEPPVVNEVSFPHNYMNYIVASSTGGGVIFVVMLCTVVIKCKQRQQPNKRKKCGGTVGGAAVVTSVTGSTGNGVENNTTDTGGLMKCSSILNDGDSLTGSVLPIGEGMTPTKLCKENGGIIVGGQMKQNVLLYAPANIMQQQQLDEAIQLNLSNLSTQHNSGSGGTPPPAMLLGGSISAGLTYCSPPSSLRNYQEKNPDLVNDAAESVKHKLKSSDSIDNDYDAASDCSGPCSIQGMPTTLQYETYCQLTPQFGSQIIRPSASTSGTRFTPMTTLPRGMQLKAVNGLSLKGATTPQHQIDVHLNPVCFLGQEGGYAYEYTNANLQQLPPQTSHHHLHLQAQHSLGSAGIATLAPQSQQSQQNFYRTLPHNRAHKQQQFASSGCNPNLRYSMEAEFIQRASTPTNPSGSSSSLSYDKYLPNVRFTAEGYPQLVQYPSPPEGYKCTNGTTMVTAIAQNEDTNSKVTGTPPPPPLQQWPPCLPGYHAQPIRYPAAMVGILSPQQQHQMSSVPPTQPLTSNSQQTQTTQQNSANSNCGISTIASSISTSTSELNSKKRCKAAQVDASTIPECDETDVSPSGSNADMAEVNAAKSGAENTNKLRHLNGPLADSPDEGYVGDSQEGSDI